MLALTAGVAGAIQLWRGENMKLEIVIARNGDKELFLNDKFLASWGPLADDMEIIIPYALEAAFKLGRENKQEEIKEVLGLS